MQSRINFDRRSFLKITSIAGGGALIGFNFLTACTTDDPSNAPTQWFDVNGYIKIGADGTITIMAPNPEIGQGVKTAMPMVVAEELDVDWENVIVEQAPLDPANFQRQVAGGSQSLRQGWDALRSAGATAREMFREAAATKWGVPVEECRTRSGVVLHQTSGKQLDYGELAPMLAGLEIPEAVTFKDPSEYRIIGKFIPNVDNDKIVTGQPLFGMDTHREGMLIAMCEHAPAFGMKLRAFDDSAVRSMPGIVEVVSFDDKVAVVGKTTWEVLQARKALKIDWEEPETAESTELHHTLLFEALQKKTPEPARKDGQPEKVFRRAARILERTYEVPFLPHNTMEPMNFFAHVRADGAELIGPIQTPERTRARIAEILGLEENSISLMLTRMGGGFGRRLYGDFASEAAMISKLTGHPIKLIYTREDDMTKGIYRPMLKSTYRAALDAHNNLLALHVRGAGINGSALREHNFPAGALAHYLAESHQLDSAITTGAWRSPVHNFVGYAEQAFLDELALEMGKDPIAFRLELLQHAKENPVGELHYDPDRFIGVINLAAEKARWDKPSDGVYRGFAAYYSHNTYVAQVADVVLMGDLPRIRKVWCAVDCGIVINRSGAETQCAGGILDGIGHSFFGKLTFRNGRPEQQNFHQFRMLQMAEAPDVEVFFAQNNEPPTGLGEPTLPPVQGAVANALSAALGTRIYKQPFFEAINVAG